MTDYKPSYIWPNPAFPFRVYFSRPECRIFIIENIPHNWEWMSKYAKNFRTNDFFFVYCGWYYRESFAIEAEKIFRLLGLQRENFFFMFNSPLEAANFAPYGLQGDLIPHNAWLDERLILPEKNPIKRYDAIYVARRTAFKRHLLASKVRSLALIAGINHGNAISPVPDHEYLNPRPLNQQEVHSKISESRCGLILSEVEGGCFASSEYLLCGIPVVSTHSFGGRDIWYDDYNARVVDPDPDAVAEAVDYFVQNPVDPEIVRENHIRLAGIFRKSFISALAMVLNRFGVADVDPEKYFTENFFHKMRKSYQPDFDSIFGKT